MRKVPSAFMKGNMNIISHKQTTLSQETEGYNIPDSNNVSINDIEAAVEILGQKISAVLKSHNTANAQLSLFSYDDAVKKHDTLNAALEKSKLLCNEQQGEIARLRSRLDLLEQAHKSLKVQNSELQKRLNNIISSFDATLGS